MGKLLMTVSMSVLLCGCANGPTHDYYNPVENSAGDLRFSGPVRIECVNDLKEAEAKCMNRGGVLMGESSYRGKSPELVELRAQARRAHANRVYYTCEYLPPQAGSWHFSLNNWGAGGGTDSGAYAVDIVFMGK